MSHLPALDGLRGVAVVAVLLYHAHANGGYLKGGYLGVDLFFVLSGFLITSLILTEHRSSGHIDLVKFWTRRVRRLLPAVLLLMVGVAFYSVFWASKIDLGDIRGDAIATLAYVANWHTIYRGVSYWDISVNPSPLSHTWSLAIEEQFYLLWPLVLVLVLRNGGRERPKRVLRFSLGLAAISASLFVGLHAIGESTTRVYQGTDTRMAAIAMGAALAAWIQWKGPIAEHRHVHWFESAGMFALVLLATAWLTLDGQSDWLYRGGLPLCSLLGVIVLAAATNPDSPYLGRIFSIPPLRWLGLISYGLYLWHWPIFQVLNETRTGLNGFSLLGIRLAVSLAIAVLSYVLLEQPIRHGALRGMLGKVSIPAGLAAAAAVVLIATAGAVAPSDVNRTAASEHAVEVIKGAPQFMFVGDSVANSLAGPTIDDPQTFGINPTNESVIGCELMYQGHKVQQDSGEGLSQPTCGQNYRQLVQTNQPQVVLMEFAAASTSAIDINGSFRDPCSPQYPAEFNRIYGKAIDDLSSGGAKVVFANVAISRNSFRTPIQNKRTDCTNQLIEKFVRNHPKVQMLDLNGFVCPNGSCPKQMNGADVRPDDVHYDGPGGLVVAKWAVAQTLKQVRLKPVFHVHPGAPTFCGDLRLAVRPITNLLNNSKETRASVRRAAWERIDAIDFQTLANRLPGPQKQDLKSLDAVKDGLKRALTTSLNTGETLTTAVLPPGSAGPLTRLDSYLKANCD